MPPDSKKRERTAHKRWSRNRPPGAAHTQLSFCENNAISESKYRQLKRDGKGPREIELDGRIIITPESESAWRREREAETAAKRAARAQREAATAAEAEQIETK
jgi:hypothetical protein